MKKLYLITILLTILMSMPMFAYDFEKDGIYYNFEGDHVSVTFSGNGVYSGSVSIPNLVRYNDVNYPVTSIGEYAFEGGEGITYLAIPSSITHIGEYAFRDCGGNMQVQIVDLAAWCKVEFGNEHSSPLSSAKKFYLKDSGVFRYKHEVKSLYIPNGVESISNFAFYQCRSITSLIIPGSVKSVGSSAFEDCTGLTSIYLSEGVESIGGSSFEGCTGISSLVLPSSLTSIAINAFKNCSSINTIVSRIQNPFIFEENVFSTYSTATLIVPEGTTTEYQSTSGWNLFENITDDSSQAPAKRTIHVTTAGTLPNLVSGDEFYIEELILTGELNGTDIRFLRAMSGIDYLIRENRNESDEPYDVTSVATPGNLKVLDITGTKIVEGGERYYIPSGYYRDYYLSRSGYYTVSNTISGYMFNGCKLTSIDLPNGVESIGHNAFCSSMTSISIPVSVTSIGESAFEGTAWYENQSDGLVYAGRVAYIYKGDMPVNTSISLYEGTSGIAGGAFRNRSNLTSITIPNSVTSIGSYAFYHCIGLTSVSIPNSVTSIGGAVFSGCSGLTSVTIPNSVTSIGSSAFSGCSGLTSITIPNSVTSIGYDAFSECSGLTSILSLNDTPPTCDGTYVFDNVVKENCVLWVPKGSVAAYMEANEWKDFQNIKEIVDGDVNLDEKVNRNDQGALVTHIMGEKPEGFFEGLADLNGDDDVNAADVVKLVDILNNGGLSTVTEFSYDNIDGSLVVSSLTCTLNNKRDEAILLTRCELYSNGSLFRSKSFANDPVSVAAGGNKSCTFENLSKPANSTDFTVCWHYTVNGESFVYRCPLTD